MDKSSKRSLRRKAILILLVLSTFFGLAVILLSLIAHANTIGKHYEKMNEALAKTIASKLDADQIKEYEETGKKDKFYYIALHDLMKAKDYHNITQLKVVNVTTEGAFIVFNTDFSDKPTIIGARDESLDELVSYAGHLETEIPANTKKSEQGWSCRVYEPVWDEKGNVIAIVVVDVSMNDIVEEQVQFILWVITGTAVIVAAFAGTVFFAIRKNFINPINTLAFETDRFHEHNNKDVLLGTYDLKNIKVDTGNEIEMLSNTISAMEKEMVWHINNLAKLMNEKKQIDFSLNLYRSIYTDILPQLCSCYPKRVEFELHANMKKSKVVGGDFGDSFLIDNERLVLVIADVSGAGIPTALFMLVIRGLIKTQAYLSNAPDEIFSKVNQSLFDKNNVGLFATAFLGILNLRTGELVYCNAGHKFPLYRSLGMDYQRLDTKPGFALAGMGGMLYKSYQLQMEPGDRLFFYTDGVTDVVDQSKVPYGDHRLLVAVNREKAYGLSLAELNEYILADVMKYCEGQELLDDIFMMLIEFKQYMIDTK